MSFQFIWTAFCTNPLISHCAYLYKNGHDNTYYLSHNAPPKIFIPNENIYQLLSDRYWFTLKSCYSS